MKCEGVFHGPCKGLKRHFTGEGMGWLHVYDNEFRSPVALVLIFGTSHTSITLIEQLRFSKALSAFDAVAVNTLANQVITGAFCPAI